MKRFLQRSIIFLFSCIILACNDDTESHFLVLETEQLNFGKDAETKYLTVSTDQKFIVKSNQSWCTPEKMEDDLNRIKISVPDYLELDPRTAKITVTTLSKELVIEVIQDSGAEPTLSVAESSVEIKNRVVDFTLEINTNVPIEFVLPDWITEKAGNPASDRKTYAFTAELLEDNPPAQRDGNIIIRSLRDGFSHQVTVPVTQLLTPLVYPSSTLLFVTDDVEVFGDIGDKNTSKGSQTTMRSYYNDGNSSRIMTFLKFDLTALASVNLSEVESIKLKVYAETVGSGGGNSTPETHTLQVFNMTACNPDFAWTESTLSFNEWLGNADLSNSAASTSGQGSAYGFRRNPDITTNYNNGNPEYRIAQLDNVGPQASNTWLEWDITNAIKNNATLNDISLQICDKDNVRLSGGSTRSEVIFHTKENESGNGAYLEINYVGKEE